MKKLTVLLVMFVALAVVAFAQDTTTTPTVDPKQVDAILVFLGGAVVTAIVQGIKALTKVTGFLALLVTGIVDVAGTFVYLKWVNPMMPVWSWVVFILYAAVIFGEATGFYHLYSPLISKPQPTA